MRIRSHWGETFRQSRRRNSQNLGIIHLQYVFGRWCYIHFHCAAGYSFLDNDSFVTQLLHVKVASDYRLKRQRFDSLQWRAALRILTVFWKRKNLADRTRNFAHLGMSDKRQKSLILLTLGGCRGYQPMPSDSSTASKHESFCSRGTIWQRVGISLDLNVNGAYSRAAFNASSQISRLRRAI
jgi:hypothetical protein